MNHPVICIFYCMASANMAVLLKLAILVSWPKLMRTIDQVSSSCDLYTLSYFSLTVLKQRNSLWRSDIQAPSCLPQWLISIKSAQTLGLSKLQSTGQASPLWDNGMQNKCNQSLKCMQRNISSTLRNRASWFWKCKAAGFLRTDNGAVYYWGFFSALTSPMGILYKYESTVTRNGLR